MHSSKLLVALAAGLVSAKSCTKDIEVTEINQVFDCDTAEKDVKISKDLSGELAIEGLKEIKGNLIANGSSITGLSSLTLQKLGGIQLTQLNDMLAIRLSSLKEISEIKIDTLPILNELAFGSSGVTQADSIIISNTNLNDLSNLKLNSVKSFSINNNGALKTFESDVVNITTEFIVENNGKDMEITLNKLKTAGELQLSNIKKFEAPLMTKAAAIKLQTNEELEDFKAPNVTSVDNSITIIDNKKLGNVSFPKLTTIGDMTIQNNTAMKEIAGFPQLQFVTSAIKLYGDFEKVELPKLKLVNGTVTVTSSTDIEEFCKFFDDAAKDKLIKGEEKCTWNNPEANQDGSEDKGQSNSGGSGGKGGSSNSEGDGEGAAGSLRASVAMLGLALVAGLTQLL